MALLDHLGITIDDLPHANAQFDPAVRVPKDYPRFSARYYASFVEDDNGIRIEFMHNPPPA